MENSPVVDGIIGHVSHNTDAAVPPGCAEDENSAKEKPEELQHGVRAAMDMAEVISKRQLILAYVFIWIIQFVLSYSQGVTTTLTPYVTSSFQQHSLTATTSIVASLIGGLIKLPYAKLIDIWGRPQGLAVMVVCMTLGLTMMAACHNVQTYAAAQVFYVVGQNGISFSLIIFIADTSSLRNRAFSIAFTNSSALFTAWMYGPTVDSILRTFGFRWGFGIWAIVVPVVCAPLFVLFWHNHRKAERAGLARRQHSPLSPSKLVLHYLCEFDVAGLLLVASGLSLFLLSFSLYSYQEKGWQSPLVISFVVIGGLLVIAFCLYEKYVAPVTFIPWTLMGNRTILATFVIGGTLYTTVTLYSAYYYSFLIIVYNLSITKATYINNIYYVFSGFWVLVLGVCFRYYGHIKWYTLTWGIPMYMLGLGLLIRFRFWDSAIGYVVMCQIFIALGGGTLYLTEQIALMAVSDAQHFPALLALDYMVISVAEAIGSTIAAAIWTSMFPQKLGEYLPAAAQPLLQQIYGNLEAQASYAVGSPERLAIDHAYGDTLRTMLIVSVCLTSISFVAGCFWEDIDVKTLKKRKTDLY